MKKLIYGMMAVCLIMMMGCQKEEVVHPTNAPVNKKEGWWMTRNNRHETPMVSTDIPLRKYDAYYVGDTNKKKPCIYLTFDCGYEQGYTPKLLKVLKKHHVPAAFFVTKGFIRENPKLIRQMHRDGHVIGNHTVRHRSMPALSNRDNKAELMECAQYCQKKTGVKMDHFMRPPMGEYNRRTLALTKNMGYKTIFWSMAYLDYDLAKQPGKAYVIQHFLQFYHPGAIPLIHNVSSSNAQALDTVIRELKKNKVRCYSLKQLP